MYIQNGRKYQYTHNIFFYIKIICHHNIFRTQTVYNHATLSITIAYSEHSKNKQPIDHKETIARYPRSSTAFF
jgi:hypothetical protein